MAKMNQVDCLKCCFLLVSQISESMMFLSMSRGLSLKN